MSAYWNFKLIFDPQEGFPAGMLDRLLGLLERMGFWAWTKAEDVPPYAIARPQSEQVLVLSTFVDHEYKTLLATDLEVVETLLTEHGGSLELRPHASHSPIELVELRYAPQKYTVALSFPWPEEAEEQRAWLRLFRQVCDRLNPLAACAYNWEALVHSGHPADDLVQAAHSGKPPQTLHSLTYLRNDYLVHVGLERLSPVSRRQDYWRRGVCLWLEHDLGEFQTASLEDDGYYQKGG
ncbi:MAG: hypothetical protein SFU83_00395 [Meiothermus sp.]|nr:hypothetical protein [Meiothermus sp.]